MKSPVFSNELREGARGHYETKRKTKDGRILAMSADHFAGPRFVRSDRRRFQVARDITERKQQEQALRAANAALSRSNADLQQFAYSASHDLQEPLRMVATYSEMLKRKFGGKLGPLGEEYIGYTVQVHCAWEQL